MLLFVTLLPLIFHMAAADSKHVVLVMTSSSSGYVTMRQNLSEEDPSKVWRAFHFPYSRAAMFSFQTLKPRLPVVLLFCNYYAYNAEGRLQNNAVTVFRTLDYNSNFGHMCDVGIFTVAVLSQTCFLSRCFQIFFSLFSQRDLPARLSDGGGLWNCSVENYPSFQHHLSCNLKTECEDGRDETGDCPFSSPECQGKMAMCDRCYHMVWALPNFNSPWSSLHELGADHCFSLRGALSVPTCLPDWFYTFRYQTQIRQDLKTILLGIRVNDISFPSMYRTSFISSDRTVLYHNFQFGISSFNRNGTCCLTHGLMLNCMDCYDHNIPDWVKPVGAICEMRTNVSEARSGNSTGIFVRSIQGFHAQNLRSMVVCNGGEVTHTFLSCTSIYFKDCSNQESCSFSYHVSHTGRVDSTNQDFTVAPSFSCSDELTALTYTVTCDFRPDCPDASDESFCKHPVCVNSFTCHNGRCVAYNKLCDRFYDCEDESDERHCKHFLCLSEFHQPQFLLSPVLVNFDGVRNFIPVQMNSSDSCPDTHYRCPGDFNDCLPVYTRCNGMFDCIHHQDEEGCEEVTCPGFFRCRFSDMCVHEDDLCDGWPHCPLHDDELLCDAACPVECQCQGHAFLCFQPFSLALFPHLRFLNATGSGLTLSDIGHHDYLLHLVLVRCSLIMVPPMTLRNLRILDLSDNKLEQVNMTSFLNLGNLRELSMSKNSLSSLVTDLSLVTHQTVLTTIDMSYTALKVFDTKPLAQFSNLQKLNLTSTSIHTINPDGFDFVPQLTELYLTGSPIKTFTPSIFKKLVHLRVIKTENYKLCCSEVLPDGNDALTCHAPKDEISSCEDLLESWTYRGFLWLTASLSVTGNIFCLCARLLARSMSSSSGFSAFVTNLTLADLLMGVYILLIGMADERYRGKYLHYDDAWKSSITCKVAGFLSLLSSEVSALIICLITLDRFVALRFPFSNLRFEPTSASLVCLVTWMVGFLLAVIPLLPVTSHWEFYSQTGICIPLPVTRQAFRGRFYSFGVLIVFNFVLFLLISSGQAFIYWSIQKNTLKTNTTKVSRDMTIAQRLITVAVTDFLCWFPIGLCGILALTGVPIPGEMNVGLAIFVLPLNSAINPFMYTFNTLAEKRRKSNEEKLLKWMESHMEDLDS